MRSRFAPFGSQCAIGVLAMFGITASIGSGCSNSDGVNLPAADSQQCASPASLCGDACVDLKNDPTNCGACNTACGAGQVCSGGTCGTACAGNTVKCGDSCVDTKVDPSNCGACGTACGAGFVCSGGQCGLTCSDGLVRCEGADTGLSQAICANVKHDSANCGGCGVQCANAERCIDGSCGRGCSTGADCPSSAAKCVGNQCVLPLDCAEVKAQNPMAPSGRYTIDPDGNGSLAPFPVWCDMVTDGGGWTIVFAHSGADNEPGIVSDIEADGNALSFQYANLSRAKKMALSALETESIFVRSNALWLKADKPLFNDQLDTPDTSTSFAVKLNGMNGAIADGYMGWSNYEIAGGGDFGITMSPDGPTCGDHTTTDGFDHHQTNYRQLNCGCLRHYLYSYSNVVADGDATYNVNTPLGGWTATAACASAEGSGIAFYAAMRRPLANYASCSAMKAAVPNAESGWYVIDADGAGPNPPVGVYCDMTTDGGGYTLLPVKGGISTKRYDEANSCAGVGMSIAVARTQNHLKSMYSTFGAGYLKTVPGVYGLAAGDYSGCAMNSSDSTCGANWKAVDGGAWFARVIASVEPSGNYAAGCWLSLTGFDANGATFNDNSCTITTGSDYLCSDNLK